MIAINDTPSPTAQILSKGIWLVGLFATLLVLGSCRWTPIIRPLSTLELPRGARAVVLYEGYAFATDGYTGLFIVDLHNPEAPDLVASLEIEPFVNNIAVSGNRAYLTTQGGHLLIVDISTPTDPQVIGSYTTGGNALDVVVKDGVAFVASGTAGLVILDVTDPTQPVFISQQQFEEWEPQASVIDITLADDLAYVSVSGLAQVILDVSNSRQPTKIVLPFSEHMLPGPWAAIRTWGRTGYASTGGGVHILDLSTPTLPQPIAFFDIPDFVMDIESYHSHLYVAELSAFRIIDVSRTDHPRIVRHFRVEQGADVAVANSYAVLADKLYGLYVFDIAPYLNEGCA